MSVKSKTLKDGLVVVFEGIDGSGKTTQLELAQKALLAQDWPVYATRNLGGTPIGEELRKVILLPIKRPSSTNLYISVAVQEALAEAIGQERAKNNLVLLDRGPLSLAAYEIYGGGLDESLGWQHVKTGMAKLNPELTILYDADIRTAIGRARQKNAKTDYFESQADSYFERVAKGYQTAAKRYPDSVVVIDANQSIEAVHQQTMDAIQRALAKKLA